LLERLVTAEESDHHRVVLDGADRAAPLDGHVDDPAQHGGARLSGRPGGLGASRA
jgi:hypothetical protein